MTIADGCDAKTQLKQAENTGRINRISNQTTLTRELRRYIEIDDLDVVVGRRCGRI